MTEKPTKTSNYSASKRFNIIDYVRSIDADLRQLYEKFRSILSINKLQVGSNNDYCQIDSQGMLSLVGNATVWEDLRFPSQALKLSGTKPPTWTTYQGGEVLGFSDQAIVGNEERVSFVAQLSHSYKEGSTIYPHLHWISTDTSTGNVVWKLSYSWGNWAGTFPTATTTTMTVAKSVVLNYHSMDSFSPISGTGKEISSILICDLSRNSSSAADTYTATAYLAEVDIHLELNTMGSKDELEK
jgi:hypothetical protein